MRICPTCGNQYSDEANFCPMDATRLPPPAAAPPPAVAPPISAGATIVDQPRIGGRFVLGAELVATPTGIVYEATDLTGAQAVHLKQVDLRALPTAMMADRAIRELRQLAKVKSERIVRVIDQGKLDDGRVFVATEALAGPTLEQLVRQQGALSFDRARAILLAIGEALTEAQKVGVIHRDVSPRNVVVDGDRIKLIDFGLAEAVSERVFGSPAFLSPEQAEGKPVDQRSNIYSLGALFFYMLTGSPPFAGERDALIQQHLHVQPQPPSARRPGLSPETDKLVLKAMEKSGGRRHLTLRQLLNEVTALTAPHGLAAPSAPRPALEVAATEISPRPRFDAVPAVALPTPEVDSPTQTMPSVEPTTAPGIPALTQEPAAPPPVIAAARALGPVAVQAVATPIQTVSTGPIAQAAPVVPPPVAVPAAAPQVIAAAPPVQVQPVPSPPPKAAPILGTPTMPLKPVADVPRPAAPAHGAEKGPRKAFRETAWFKKGEIEEEMQRSSAAQATEDPLAGVPDGKEAVVDENALTADDRQRLSLKTGRTEAMPVVKAGPLIPGDQMSEEEMLAEVDSSRRKMMIAGVLLAGVMLVGTIAYFLIK